MAKKGKKQSKALNKKFKIHNPRRFVLLALLVLGLGYITYNQIVLYQDKQLFKRAEIKVDEIHNQIIAITGEPSKVVSQKSCGRASLKHSQGPLLCNTTKHNVFQVSNFAEATHLLNEVSRLSAHALRSTSLTQGATHVFVEQAHNSRPQEFFQKLEDFKSLNCTLSYEYPINIQSAYYELLMPLATENLRIGISCGGPAKSQHYPLRD